MDITYLDVVFNDKTPFISELISFGLIPSKGNKLIISVKNFNPSIRATRDFINQGISEIQTILKDFNVENTNIENIMTPLFYIETCWIEACLQLQKLDEKDEKDETIRLLKNKIMYCESLSLAIRQHFNLKLLIEPFSSNNILNKK